MTRSARGSLMLLLLLGWVPTVAADTGAKPTSASPAPAPDPERTRREITALLTSFLSPEQNPTRAAHERFWADDLVYTSSAGKVTNKAEILKSFDPAPGGETPKAGSEKTPEPEPVYSAEDVLVRPYGEMAALTFRRTSSSAHRRPSPPSCTG